MSKCFFQFLILIILPIVPIYALDFNPALNQGIDFPDTPVDEESEVQMTVFNNANVQYTVTWDAPGAPFSVDPLQHVIAGNQMVVFTFRFNPQDIQDYQANINGRAVSGMQIQRLATSLRGTGVAAGDPRIEIDADTIRLVRGEPFDNDEKRIVIGNQGEGRLEFEIEIEDRDPWFEVEPMDGEIAVDDEETIFIRTNDILPDSGFYVSEFIISSNDPDNEEIPIRVELLMGYQPRPVVSVEHGDLVIVRSAPHDIDNTSFTIENTGERRLDWELIVDEAADWLEVTPLNGQLNPEARRQVVLRGTDIVPDSGDYETEIIIRSNAIPSENDTITVGMAVRYVPHATMSVDTQLVVLHVVDIENPDQDRINLQNSGERMLEYSIMMDDQAAIVVEPDGGQIEPGQSSQLTVSNDVIDQPNNHYEYEFAIVSNDPEQQNVNVRVLMNIDIPGNHPTANLDKALILLEITDPEIPAMDSLFIQNSGLYVLEYNILVDSLPDWLTVDPISGSVNSMEHDKLEFSTTVLIPENGLHSTNVYFTTNDPENAVVQFEVRLDVSIEGVGGHNGGTIPKVFFLDNPYPNPFNSSSTIQYGLPVNTHAVVKLYDIHGVEVQILSTGMTSAGIYKLMLDAGDLPSGLYFVTLQAKDFRSTKKLMLVR